MIGLIRCLCFDQIAGLAVKFVINEDHSNLSAHVAVKRSIMLLFIPLIDDCFPEIGGSCCNRMNSAVDLIQIATILRRSDKVQRQVVIRRTFKAEGQAVSLNWK
jgi:hypothetical protein